MIKPDSIADNDCPWNPTNTRFARYDGGVAIILGKAHGWEIAVDVETGAYLVLGIDDETNTFECLEEIVGNLNHAIAAAKKAAIDS